MTTHHPTIEPTESITLDDGRLLYRARCSCRWLGWAVFDQETARRHVDRHIEQAELDRAVLKGRAGEMGTE